MPKRKQKKAPAPPAPASQSSRTPLYLVAGVLLVALAGMFFLVTGKPTPRKVSFDVPPADGVLPPAAVNTPADPTAPARFQKGVTLAKDIMTGEKSDLHCDVLILDEVIVALNYTLIKPEQLLEIMDMKPPGMELVLTGRGATPEIIEKADLVTEMVEIKHYFQQGIETRPGFDH